jgi:hypothetical protein
MLQVSDCIPVPPRPYKSFPAEIVIKISNKRSSLRCEGSGIADRRFEEQFCREKRKYNEAHVLLRSDNIIILPS